MSLFKSFVRALLGTSIIANRIETKVKNAAEITAKHTNKPYESPLHFGRHHAPTRGAFGGRSHWARANGW
jgi:hypothetical protein